MGSPDPSAGRLALAPTDPGLPRPDERGERPGQRRPEVFEAPRHRAGVGRRRLVAVTILLTVAAAVYFGVASFGGGGGAGGAPTEDAYLRANRLVATEGLLVIKAGTDLRALRDIDRFRSDVDQSIARITAQTTALQRLGAKRQGTARSTIDETVAGAQRISLLATVFERDVAKGNLGPANRDEQSLREEIVTLARLSTQWKHAQKK